MYKLIIICLFISKLGYTQVYYNPRNAIDINVTIKKPFEPVNYQKMTNDINNSIKSEMQRRALLKKHYEEIYFQTKTALNTNMILTNENEIDRLIIKLQDFVDKELDQTYQMLTGGLLPVRDYEYTLSRLYYNFHKGNKQIAYLAKYKYDKLNDNYNKENISQFNSVFKSCLNKTNNFKIKQDYDIYWNEKQIGDAINNITTKCEKELKQIEAISIDEERLAETNSNKYVKQKKIEKIKLNSFNAKSNYININPSNNLELKTDYSYFVFNGKSFYSDYFLVGNVNTGLPSVFLELGLADDGRVLIKAYSETLEQQVYMTNNLIFQLRNNKKVICYDRKIREKIDNKVYTYYLLSSNDVSLMEKFNIETISFSIADNVYTKSYTLFNDDIELLKLKQLFRFLK